MHSLPLEDAWLVPRWTFLPDEGRLTVIHPTRPHPYDPSRRHVPCAQQRDSAANAFVCSPLPTHLTAARSAAHHPRRMSPEQADAAAISRLSTSCRETRPATHTAGRSLRPVRCPNGPCMDLGVVGQALSGLGKAAAPALIARARELGIPLPAELDDPGADIPPRLIIPVLRQISVHFSHSWRQPRTVTLFSLLSIDTKRPLMPQSAPSHCRRSAGG